MELRKKLPSKRIYDEKSSVKEENMQEDFSCFANMLHLDYLATKQNGNPMLSLARV